MSTLSGNANKGEKGKKFQQLRINLYSANKPSEPEQQQCKSSIQRKQHGMTSLGKVPTARRPTNLPSEKSEHNGNDPAVNLVPSGGAGWGNKSDTGLTTTPSLPKNTTPPTTVAVKNVTSTGTSQQVPLVQHYPPTSRMTPVSMGAHVPVHHGHADSKTWAVMAHGGDLSAPNFLTPQSPLFQQEFPSLSSNIETSSTSTLATATATQKPMANITVDTQYGPGPSLRPQTEGSWIHGGSRPQGSVGPAGGNQSAAAPVQVHPMGPYPPHIGPDGVRNNLAPSGVVGAPGGHFPSVMPQQLMMPPQFNGMMPSFMLRNMPSGNFPPNFQGSIKGVGARPSYGPNPPNSVNDSATKRTYDEEDMKIRPIIKDEDLNHMASIGKDIGWAGHEEIDYNQQLKFSDDEDDDKSKDNRSKIRAKPQGVNTNDKVADRKNIGDKENDLRSSKESMKDREKSYTTDQRPPETKNVWQMRRTVLAAGAPPGARYQIPANGRIEEDEEALQEKVRQKREEMEKVIRRAQERKEEEEKRFNEVQQAAAMKLKKLEAAMFGVQPGKDNKMATGNDSDVSFHSSANANGEDIRKGQTPAAIPVVKDASEFRELTQLLDPSHSVKKETKERENAQQSNYGSRAFNAHIPPRFQNMARQNSGGFSSSQSGPPARSIISQNSQFTNKLGHSGFTIARSNRKDSEQSDKDCAWDADERKDRDAERYSKESSQERDYGYNYDDERKYESKFDMKFKHYNEKDDYGNETYEREASHPSKIERKSSESDREKCRTYDNRRFADSEKHENDGRCPYDEPEKSRHYNSSSARSPRTFSENENAERKRSREEYNSDRDYYRKSEKPEEKERVRESFADFKKEAEAKRDYEHDLNVEKDKERKSPSSIYDDRMAAKDGRFYRGSRESLRDGSYIFQHERSYSGWNNESEMDERKGRRDHYREDRNDRYSHAQRHVPRPITKAKLEAKELESDSKANLTALVRSDKKVDLKKADSDLTKEKDKSTKIDSVEGSIQKSASSSDATSAWKREDKKQKEESKSGQATSAATNEQNSEKNDSVKHKDDRKDSKASSKEESADKSDEKRKSDRRSGKDSSSHGWTRYPPVFHGSSYGSGRNEGKSRRPNKGSSVKGPSRRDSKYSESEYSDEVGGEGREDPAARSDREKGRPAKSKRYDRDDRNREYRTDERDYGGSRGRNSRDYYYPTKPVPRGRVSGYRGSGASAGKRMEGYGPPTTKNPFGASSAGPEERKPKAAVKEKSATNADASAAEKKSESAKISYRAGDRSWKKAFESGQTENKSTGSSFPTSNSAEVNEEAYATATEGSDSEETGAISKNKSSYTSKRSPTVVATKQPRNPFRSTSGKRYESRRTGPLYSRKDSGSYSSGGSKRNAVASGSKSCASNKENEKYNEETGREARPYSKDESKVTDKISKDNVTDGHKQKNVKVKKNTRSGSGASGGRKGASDAFARPQTKPKSFDGKFGDYKDLKSGGDSGIHFREVGPPIPAPPPTTNAWEKPLTGALRTGSPSVQRPVGSPAIGTAAANMPNPAVTQDKSVAPPPMADQHKESLLGSATAVGTSVEKVTTMVLENLDGSTAPVQTIIFENTNFKSGPTDPTSKSKFSSQIKSHRFDRDTRLDGLDSNVSSFRNDSSNSELPSSEHDPLHMAALFNKNEDVADMKLDFAFDPADFSKLADVSKTAKALELTHAMHMMQSSTDADLNFKIAAVKKVWDGSLAEHYDDQYDGGMVNTSASFSQPFSNHGSDPNGVVPCFSHVDSGGHVQVDDVGGGGLGHSEVVYSPVSQMQGVNSVYGGQTVVMKNDSNTSCSNVCKVKPQPQGTGSSMVNAGPSSMSTTLVSQPPPLSSPSYTFSSTPQPNLSNGAVAASALTQLNFPTQYSVSPVPSSPVLFNSTQTAVAGHAGLYQAFQIDGSQVATRSQFSQYPSYSLSGALGQTSAFSQQSMFVPPPTAAPPDIYSQTLHPFRLQPQTAFGNTQQITSPNTTMLTSNSLMSAPVKPSSAIGSKTTGFQAAQSSAQIFMQLDGTQVLNSNLFAGSQIIQRPNSVVAAGSLPASTSFYSSASGTGQSGYFANNNSSLQAQAALGLATLNTQSVNQPLGPAIANYNSQLPYKSTQAYLKNSGNMSNLTDFGGSKTITLSSQHDVLNPAYQQSSQMNKQRLQQGNKNMQNLPQGLSQHSLAQSSYGYQATNPMRNNGSSNKASQYPHPIQRPVSQGNSSNRGNGGASNAGNASASHRMSIRNSSHQLVNNIQQPPSSVYYSTSSGYSTGSSKLEASQLESKVESNADENVAESIKSMNTKNASVASEKGSTSNE